MNDALEQFLPNDVENLDAKETAELRELLRVWHKHLGGNRRRRRYYDQKKAVDGLGISVPDKLKDLMAFVGWPALAVDELADRSIFEGFACDGDIGWLESTMDDNDFMEAYDQALSDELIGCCAFGTVSAGGHGEPEVLMGFYGPEDAAALWDWRKKRIRSGIALVDVEIDESGYAWPVWVNLYTSKLTAACRRGADGKWRAERIDNIIGRPLMEPFAYLPDTRRPFGRSRITRAVMSITDCAMREVQRSEIAAEFAALPQKYLVGVDPKTFGEDEQKKYKAWMGAILALTANKNGDLPNVGQFAQIQMQPHIDYMQSLAKRFAGETGIPLNTLGVVQDNPSSADAMFAAERGLIAKAERLNRRNGRSLRNMARLAACVRDGCSMKELRDSGDPVWNVRPVFRDEVRSSKAANADYAIKLASVVPSYASTEMFWRAAGYSETESREILSAISRADASRTILESIASSPSPRTEGAV